VANRRRLSEFTIGLLFLIVVWSIFASVVGNNNLFPSPLSTLRRLVELMQMPTFFSVVGVTMARVVIGLSIALGVAMILGIASSFWPNIGILLSPLVSVIKTIPNISIIVQLIIWLGPVNAPLAVGITVMFPLLYAAVHEGIANIDPDLLEMADLYEVSRWQRLRYIYLPSLVTQLSTSVTAAVGLNIKIMVGAEYISHAQGSLGSSLYLSNAYFDIPGVMAWSIVAIMTAVIMEIPARYLKNRMTRWEEIE